MVRSSSLRIIPGDRDTCVFSETRLDVSSVDFFMPIIRKKYKEMYHEEIRVDVS